MAQRQISFGEAPNSIIKKQDQIKPLPKNSITTVTYRDKLEDGDETDEETINTVKQQLKAALLEEIRNYLQYKLQRLQSTEV